jgi:hypothetical protein
VVSKQQRSGAFHYDALLTQGFGNRVQRSPTAGGGVVRCKNRLTRQVTPFLCVDFVFGLRFGGDRREGLPFTPEIPVGEIAECIHVEIGDRRGE